MIELRLGLFTLCLLLNSLLFAATDKFRCMWRDDPSTTMVIGWNQVSGNNPVLYFDYADRGPDASQYLYSRKPDRKITSKGMNNHFVRLSGLEPGTVYHFIIADSEGVSQSMSFRTAPNHPDERLSVIAGGDSRNFRKARRKANKLVAKLRPHLVLFGGDMTGGDNTTQWRAWFDDWQHTITEDGRLTPIVVTRGNHEYSNKTLTDLFDVQQKHLYYGLSFGGDLLRVYTLNSLIACGGQQAAWLEADLENHQHMRWKMAQYHFAIRPHTRKKREQHGQYKSWASLFYQHQVNLVVESDAHCVKTTWPVRPGRGLGSDEGFMRDDERGTVYIGEGCWGAPLRRNDDDKAWTRNSGSFNQFKWIFIDRNAIEVRTIKTDNADFVDSVDPSNVFVPPNGLDIWQPSNGPVLVIHPQDRTGGQEGPLLVSRPNEGTLSNYAAEQLEVFDFNAEVKEEAVNLSWQTRNEPSRRITFELQRSSDGHAYQTIAKVTGLGVGGNLYRILDDPPAPIHGQTVSYRLQHRLANGNNSIHELKDICIDEGPWQDYHKIEPDPRTGLLKIKYALGDYSDVSIQLINTRQQSMSLSEYKNQRPGNFLKSINMRDMPKGRYLLTIRANEKVIKQLQVLNGV